MHLVPLLYAAPLLVRSVSAGVLPRSEVAVSTNDARGFSGDSCPPFTKGTFDIDAYQLYPENMDWDGKLCQVYIGILFNASFGIYDPYKDKLQVLTFPGVSHIKQFHVGGVAWDKHTGLVSVIIGQGNAFETGGATISGDNFITKYDPVAQKFLWQLNATAVTQGRYGGFNDIAHDPAGNTFVCGTFPSSILKIDPRGAAVTPWYLPPEPLNHTVRGYSGIAAAQGTTLIALDSLAGQLFRFDATAERGTPVAVPHFPNASIENGDAIRLPLKFGGKVLLVAENLRGVSVLRSRDGSWTEAEYLGLIPQDRSLPEGQLTTSMVQIGDKIFMVTDWFADPVVPGTTAGNRTSFPMVDITGDIDALLHAGKGW
ncbi:hypothetical protein QBC47DRAFT_409747 [Echria macrotheca]|uniref:Uncharacterized protein n=1 Tax=Echria macrotheca TaxID=438768 RepID=A0AAJ0FF92_9PEZI|nr:hypothetical protein QBC47DRAFT_409747 [Echria macrotheca]